jgi:Zn-dependent protease
LGLTRSECIDLMKCEICDTDESIPFRCNYCNKVFCHMHRIPINHSCVSMKEYVDKKNIMYDDKKNSNLKRPILKIKFSKIEILHLLIATTLVTAVGLSLDNYRRIALEFLIIFVSAFLVHELAHKLLAQFYGSWAEFRTNSYGLIVTAFSAIPFIPFKFIAPGAVMVDLSDRSKFGRVAFVGPLTNLVMGFIFLMLAYQFPAAGYLYTGAIFNSWIALFNLLPFGNLDGQKIFGWNKIVWILMMVGSMGLFVISQY